MAGEWASEADVRALCRLLRLGELHAVHHPHDEARAVFKAALREYQRLKRHEVYCQLQVKALYRGWGVLHFAGNAVYRAATRAQFLERISQPPIRDQLTRIYALLDTATLLRTQCWSQIVALGRAEPMIAEFQKVPGVGPIGAHLFAAFIAEPARFKTKQALWRYARLAITQRSSDGKQLGYQRLEKKGNSALKAMSYYAWKGALQTKAPNEVKTFFEQSLARTGNRTHARLNTQRKILATLWSLWRHQSAWRPEAFQSHTTHPAPAAAAADS